MIPEEVIDSYLQAINIAISTGNTQAAYIYSRMLMRLTV